MKHIHISSIIGYDTNNSTEPKLLNLKDLTIKSLKLLLIFLLLFISSRSFATLKLSVQYPKGKLKKSVKFYKSKGKAYGLLKTQKGEVSKVLPEKVFEQIRKNFLSLYKKRKKIEYACPKRIQITLSVNDKYTIYCDSTPYKKSAAKLFNRLEKIILGKK